MIYNLKEIANFGSLYTTRLYELIVEYKSTGWIYKTIDELKHALAISPNKYKIYRDFKYDVLRNIKNEINKYHPNLSLDFQEIKEGRKVKAIKFIFKKSKQSDNCTNSEKQLLLV